MLSDFFLPPGALVLPIRARSPEAVEEQLAASITLDGRHVHEQHVVSRVLLKEFSSVMPKGRRVESYRLDTGTSKATGLGQAGVKTDLLPLASASAEELWRDAENRMGRILAKGALTLDSLRDPSLVQTINDIIALHYARSLAVVAMGDQIFENVRTQLKSNLVEHLGGAGFLKSGGGLYVRGSDVVDGVVERVLRDSSTARLVRSGGWRRVRMEHLYVDARDALRPLQISLLRAREKEFLIGDVPVITIRDSPRSFGIMGGVPIGRAEGIFLPLGPSLLAFSATQAAVFDADPEVVDEINSIQVRLAHDRVFFRPGAQLGAFVSVVRRAQPAS